MTGGEAQRDDGVPANSKRAAPDDPRVRELHELVGHVNVLAGPAASRAAGQAAPPPAPAPAAAPTTTSAAAPPAAANAAPVPAPTGDVLDELDRMEAGLRAAARNNADAGARSAKKAARRGRVERCLVALVVLAAFVWVADNALGYEFSKGSELRVFAAGRAARVEVPREGHPLVDCWETGSVENVWKAAPPMDRLVPYRCGDGFASVLVPGPMSVFALGTVFFGILVLLWSWRRRRRGTWY